MQEGHDGFNHGYVKKEEDIDMTEIYTKEFFLDKIVELRLENERIKEQARKEIDSALQDARLFRRTSDDFKKQLKEALDRNKKLEVFNQNLKRENDDLRDLMVKIDRDSDQCIEDLQEDILGLEDEIDMLKKELKKRDEDIKILDSTIEKLLDKNSELRLDKMRLESYKHTLESQVKKKDEQIYCLNDSCALLEVTVENLQSTNKHLRDRIKKLTHNKVGEGYEF